MNKDHLYTRLEQIAVKFTKWMGSVSSIIFHSIFFVMCLVAPFFGLSLDRTLLFLTTLVSLEAIYLGILIQFTVNRSNENLEKVEKNIDEIQEDIDEIQEDVGEIQEDVDEIQEDVDEIQEDIDEIQEDVDEIQEDVDEIQEDVEEGEEEKENKTKDLETKELMISLQNKLEILIKDIEKIKLGNKTKK